MYKKTKDPIHESVNDNQRDGTSGEIYRNVIVVGHDGSEWRRLLNVNVLC